MYGTCAGIVRELCGNARGKLCGSCVRESGRAGGSGSRKVFGKLVATCVRDLCGNCAGNVGRCAGIARDFGSGSVRRGGGHGARGTGGGGGGVERGEAGPSQNHVCDSTANSGKADFGDAGDDVLPAMLLDDVPAASAPASSASAAETLPLAGAASAPSATASVAGSPVRAASVASGDLAGGGGRPKPHWNSAAAYVRAEAEWKRGIQEMKGLVEQVGKELQEAKAQHEREPLDEASEATIQGYVDNHLKGTRLLEALQDTAQLQKLQANPAEVAACAYVEDFAKIRTVAQLSERLPEIRQCEDKDALAAKMRDLAAEKKVIRAALAVIAKMGKDLTSAAKNERNMAVRRTAKAAKAQQAEADEKPAAAADDAAQLWDSAALKKVPIPRVTLDDIQPDVKKALREAGLETATGPYILRATPLISKVASGEEFKKLMGSFMAEFVVSNSYKSSHGRAQVRMQGAAGPIIAELGQLTPAWALDPTAADLEREVSDEKLRGAGLSASIA